MLVGKEASVDHATMIARNEDAEGGINPKRLIYVPAQAESREFVSTFNGFHVQLPGDALGHTLTPMADTTTDGEWGESGINSANVGMSATETEFTNAAMLGLDPLVPDGIGEEAMLSTVLPFVKTAREGVRRLGALISEFGTCESNGIAFSDVDEVWYFETVGGHHWAAQRIPDDAYVIAPNQTGIQEIRFDDPDHFIAAPDLEEFAEKNHLNTAKEGFNFREIFGEDLRSDRFYNTPRVWSAQRHFQKDLPEVPESRTLPFIQHAPRKISVQDVAMVLSDHMQGTPYDPYGRTGNAEEKSRYRPIGMNRNQEMHILEIRNDVPVSYRSIHWLAMGMNPFTFPLPFYANVNDTPEFWKNTTNDATTENWYWLNKIVANMVDPLFAKRDQDVMNRILNFRRAGFAIGTGAVAKADAALAQDDSDAAAKLTAANDAMAAQAVALAKTMLTDVTTLAADRLTLQFEKGGEM
ncbi:C69 family dipeptidase [Schleiferilactobacillus shenzhenensis]|uniref:Dipeptidase n=1 Tax=Schleiferilactobacillus shenzhenensis LY-73 TaxID=1231336 RepID=U4TKH5_9LACO|nr:C69 family dipeptidase [Schleiferilactobacillus shenzhenensis]ERL64714.1 PepDB [Schleiferilactobacillus shenzhenensis LY-73]